MKMIDLPIEAYLEQFLSNVKVFSKSGYSSDRPKQSVYQVVGDYQQAWLEGESLKRFSKDLRDLPGDGLKTLMAASEYTEIEKRSQVWLEKHAEVVYRFI